jgi:hypothetical protein
MRWVRGVLVLGMSGALVGVFPVGASAADTLSGTTPTSAPANPNTNTP